MLPNPRRQVLLLALLLSLMCLLMSGVSPSSAASGPTAKRAVKRSLLAAWSRVARCESGGWRVLGRAYPDSLGITRVNWLDSGGVPLPVGDVGPAERAYQIRIAERFIRAYHVGIPDRIGCAAW